MTGFVYFKTIKKNKGQYHSFAICWNGLADYEKNRFSRGYRGESRALDIFGLRCI